MFFWTFAKNLLLITKTLGGLIIWAGGGHFLFGGRDYVGDVLCAPTTSTARGAFVCRFLDVEDYRALAGVADSRRADAA